MSFGALSRATTARPANALTVPVNQPPTPIQPSAEPVAPIPPVEMRLPAGVYTVQLAPGTNEARFTSLPISLRSVDARPTALAARLEALSPEVAAQLSPAGIAFTLAVSRTAAAPAGTALYLMLDYDQLNLPTYGASFRERLTLYRGLDCQESSAAVTCRVFLPLPSVNDSVQGRLTVDLAEAARLAQQQTAADQASPAAKQDQLAPATPGAADGSGTSMRPPVRSTSP